MTGNKYNTPIQNQQIMLAEQRRKIENSNTLSKVKANKQVGIVNEPVISFTKESKALKKQHQQRNARLKQEANISAKLSKSAQLVEEVVEPVNDTRSFAEKQADELYQQEEGLKNAKKL